MKQSDKKVPPQRKRPPSGGRCDKAEEATVVKLYQPTSKRKKNGTFPEVVDPKSTKCIQSHPVFKLVDNLLSSTSMSGKAKRKPVLRNVPCCKNGPVTPQVTVPTLVPRTTTLFCAGGNCGGKTASRPPSSDLRNEKIKANVCNIHSGNNIRVSIKPLSSPDDPNKSRSDCSVVSNTYLEQLRTEIQLCKSRVSEMAQKPDNNYLDHLRSEIAVTKSRYLEDTKNIINELKAEILNYRMGIIHSPCSSNVDKSEVREEIPEKDETLEGTEKSDVAKEKKCNIIESTQTESGEETASEISGGTAESPEKVEDITCECNEDSETVVDVNASGKFTPQSKELRELQTETLEADEDADTEDNLEDEAPRDEVHVDSKESTPETDCAKTCEKLWQSKSAISHSETSLHLIPQCLKFEEKLEEATSLIDKVKKALKEIGKGMQTKQGMKTETEGMSNGDVEVTSMEAICSFHGKCRAILEKIEKENKKAEEDELFEANEVLKECECETLMERIEPTNTESMEILQSKLNTIVETSESEEGSSAEKIEEKVEEAPKKPRRSVVIVSTTERASSPIFSPEELNEYFAKDDYSRKPTVSMINPLHKLTSSMHGFPPELISADSSRIPIHTCSSVEHIVCESSSSPISRVVPEEVETSVGTLLGEVGQILEHMKTDDAPQEPAAEQKLEETPTDEVPDGEEVKDLGKEMETEDVPKADAEPKVEVTKIEDVPKVCSNATCHEVAKVGEITEVEDTICEKSKRSLSLKSGEGIYSSLMQQIANEPTAVETKRPKSRNLSVQKLPPISIRSGLVMQKTLHLTIKPSGTCVNEIGSSLPNIGYEEFREPVMTTTFRCPGRQEKMVQCQKCAHPDFCKQMSHSQPNVQAGKAMEEGPPQQPGGSTLCLPPPSEKRYLYPQQELMKQLQKKSGSSLRVYEENDVGELVRRVGRSFAISVEPEAANKMDQDEMLMYRSYQILQEGRNRTLGQSSTSSHSQPSLHFEANLYQPLLTESQIKAQLDRQFPATDELLATGAREPSKDMETQASDSDESSSDGSTPELVSPQAPVKTPERSMPQAPVKTPERSMPQAAVKTPERSMPQPPKAPCIRPEAQKPITCCLKKKPPEAEPPPVPSMLSESPFKPMRSPYEIGFYQTKEVQCDDIKIAEANDRVLYARFQLALIEEPVKDIEPPKKEPIPLVDSTLSEMSSSSGTSVASSRRIAADCSCSSSNISCEEPSFKVTPTALKESQSPDLSLMPIPATVAVQPVPGTPLSVSLSSSDDDETSRSTQRTSGNLEEDWKGLAGTNVKETRSMIKTKSSVFKPGFRSPSQSSKVSNAVSVSSKVEEKTTENVVVQKVDSATAESIAAGDEKIMEITEAKKEDTPEAKKSKPVEAKKSEGSKVDMDTQVCLSSSSSASSSASGPSSKQSKHSGSKKSSESSDSSFYKNTRPRANTISHFIQGLTGTSHDELQRLRSKSGTLELPKEEDADEEAMRKTKVRVKPRTSQNLSPKRQSRNVEEEEEVRSHTFSNSSDEADVKESGRGRAASIMLGHKQDMDTTFKMIRKLSQKRAEKAEKDKTVMTCLVENPKNPLPFYRRVLGKVIDSRNKSKIIEESSSDPIKIDQSISEGELGCKCSISTGEIHHCKYDKDIGKSVRYLKKHPENMIRKELGDKNLKIARQRTQYNNWVTYYLEKDGRKKRGLSSPTRNFFS